jgi:azurin/glucose/arabinose dehydrogenase/lysophospholipase L1-like esterase
MKHIFSLTFLLAALAAPAQSSGFSAVDSLSDNAYLLYGNGLAVRLQEHGYFEAFLQLAEADKKLQLRSLSYTGDQVHYRLRPAKFSAHLNQLLSIWKGQHVLLFFGQNEAFEGEAGLNAFTLQLKNYLGMIQGRHSGAKLTLVSPIAVEDLANRSLPETGPRNAALASYVKAMKGLAAAQGIGFVDLFGRSQKLYKQEAEALTLDGLYLNDRGNLLIGRELAAALRPNAEFAKVAVDSPWFSQLLSTVKRKVHHVAESYRPSNGVHYYSVRARSYEYQAEVPHHMTLANQLDRRIWRLAASPGSLLEAVTLPTKQAKAPSKAGRRGTGKMLTVKEDLATFEVADDFALGCFASNEEFPDLINPMQVRTGPKGRIWVSTFSSYPIPVPGADAKDKILIFEDSNGDGKADTRKVFADNLLLPDGFVFYRDGLVVSIPRKLIWLRDTDGDDQVDETVELLCGIDDTDTHHGGFLSSTANGRITICEGVFHRTQFETPWGVVHSRDSTTLSFDPRSRRVAVERQTSAPNPWKISYNSWGEGYQMFGGGQTIDMDHYNLGLAAGSKPMNAGMLFRHDKGCGITAVSGSHFPAAWHNSTISGHLLGRNTVIYTPLAQDKGVYKQSGSPRDLINSPNKAFRPVDLTFGLDGALYISDLYYPIIGHAQHSVRDRNRDYSHGRIWRLTHKTNPLLKAPKIAGQPLEALLALLTHPQIRVRELVRVEMDRFPDAEVAAAVKAWLPAAATDDASVVKLLEALWLYERRGIEDPSVIKLLLVSEHSQGRAVGMRSLRFWAKHLGDEAVSVAEKALKDPVERVRLEAISAISFLQWDDAKWNGLLTAHAEGKGTGLAVMLGNARKAPETRLKPVVPILAPAADTQLRGWIAEGKAGTIWLRAAESAEVTIGSSGNSQMNVDVNDLPVIRNAGNNFTSDFQSPATLKKGLNKIHYFTDTAPTKKGRKPRKPTVRISLSDLGGKKPSGVSYPKNSQEAKTWAAAYAKDYAIVGDTHIYLKAVPGKLAFNQAELTVKAGKTYRFIFENPDIIMHNFILTKPGQLTAVGRLADSLAATPDGFKKHYIPDSDLVLFATEQAAAGQTLEVEFTAPKQPGAYPFLCTFPGHWQIMRGTMTVK